MTETATVSGPDDPLPFDRRRVVRWLIVIVGAGLVLGFVWDALFGRLFPFQPADIGDWLNKAGPWAPLVYIGAMIVAIIASPIPSAPLDIAAGLTFGLFWGTIYTLIGAEIGAVIAFLIARRLGRPRLARRLSPEAMGHIDDLSERVGLKAIIVLRLLPAFNVDWVSYAAGLTAISLPRFAIATLIGMTPPVIAITAVGSTYADSPVLSISILVVLVLLATGPLMLLLRRPRRDATIPSQGDAQVPGG
ncbi:MAG: TVP38/TMEM64 family protein [Chloroflexota bacterium]|nr:TVP38/TMEM64 family protein [Chloroflexota bacterium]